MLIDKDLDTDMAKDWADIQDKFAAEDAPVEAPATEVDEPAAELETDDTDASAPDTRTAAERARDGKTGQFTRQPKVKEPKAAATEQTAATSPEARKTEPAQGDGTPSEPAPLGQPRDTTRAPSSWKPTARAMWDKLAPEIRAEIHRREGDFQAGQAQLLPDATFGKSVREAVEPYRMLLDSAGATPERAISDMLRQAAVLRTGTPQQKYQTVAQIAHYYGLDLRVFGQPQTDANGQPLPQPAAQPQEFRDPRVDQLLGQLQAQERASAHREEQTRTQAVDVWMNAMDAQGNPLRPYVGDVITEMSSLVPEIIRTNPQMTHAQALDAAYERATWANPEVRALLMQQQQTTTDQERRADNQRRVQEARRGSSVNVARRASAPSPGKPGTLEDTIADTARELGLI